MEKQLKVLLTTNIPAPYMVDYLDCLGEKCDLTVIFEKATVRHRKTEWYGKIHNKSFNAIVLNFSQNTKINYINFRVLRYIKKDYDRIIVANPTTPVGIIVLLYCRWINIPFVIQSEGGFRGSGKGLKERFKKYIMEKANLYLSGMKGESDYFLSYGATQETLRWYPFSSLKCGQLDEKIVSDSEKSRLRKELNITEKRVLLSVGQPIFRKGFDVLLQASVSIPKEVGIYIVGGASTIECQTIIDNYGLDNVYFIDHCDYALLEKYYHAADIFVLPTREDTWGLVINEAMAKGLPVITTDMCIAGTQLIEDDVNGYVVPVESVEILAQKINQLIGDKEKRLDMARNNLNKIQQYTIENMAEIIFKTIVVLN